MHSRLYQLNKELNFKILNKTVLCFGFLAFYIIYIFHVHFLFINLLCFCKRLAKIRVSYIKSIENPLDKWSRLIKVFETPVKGFHLVVDIGGL